VLPEFIFPGDGIAKNNRVACGFPPCCRIAGARGKIIAKMALYLFDILIMIK